MTSLKLIEVFGAVDLDAVWHPCDHVAAQPLKLVNDLSPPDRTIYASNLIHAASSLVSWKRLRPRYRGAYRRIAVVKAGGGEERLPFRRGNPAVRSPARGDAQPALAVQDLGKAGLPANKNAFDHAGVDIEAVDGCPRRNMAEPRPQPRQFPAASIIGCKVIDEIFYLGIPIDHGYRRRLPRTRAVITFDAAPKPWAAS